MECNVRHSHCQPIYWRRKHNTHPHSPPKRAEQCQRVGLRLETDYKLKFVDVNRVREVHNLGSTRVHVEGAFINVDLDK